MLLADGTGEASWSLFDKAAPSNAVPSCTHSCSGLRSGPRQSSTAGRARPTWSPGLREPPRAAPHAPRRLGSAWTASSPCRSTCVRRRRRLRRRRGPPRPLPAPRPCRVGERATSPWRLSRWRPAAHRIWTLTRSLLRCSTRSGFCTLWVETETVLGQQRQRMC